MIDSLLDSRIDSGHPSNDEFFDEDVNVYLANLLTAMVYKGRADDLSKHVVRWDIPLFESVHDRSTPREKYIRYRANADFLLVSLGIFGNPTSLRHNCFPHMKIHSQRDIGRGKTYYQLASSYAMETFRRHTAISDIMYKLARGFEKYVDVFSTMKSCYFNMVPKLSDGEFFHLQRSMLAGEDSAGLAEEYDRFLDAYMEYKRSGTAAGQKALEEAAGRVRRLDPGFSFDPVISLESA
jgi:hypothetical protein